MLIAPALLGPVQQERGERGEQSQAQIQRAIDPAAPMNAEGDQRTAEERDEADVKAQERMAAAAERSTDYSLLALIGLGGTVLFAALAWWEARKSAKADNDALRLTRKQLALARKSERRNRFVAKRQSRAYVHVSDAWLDYREEFTGLAAAVLMGEGGDADAPKHRPVLKLRIKNVGQTATTFVSYHVVAGQEETGALLQILALPDPGGNNRMSNLAPQSSRVFEASPYVSLEKVLEHLRKHPRKNPVGAGLFGRMPDHFTVRGRIRYVDVFGDRFESEFGFFCYPPTPGTRIKMTPMYASFPIYANRNSSKPPPTIIDGPVAIIDEPEQG